MSWTLYGTPGQTYYVSGSGTNYHADNVTGRVVGVADADLRALVDQGLVNPSFVPLGQLAIAASGDGTKALYGDGTFKTPGGGSSPVSQVRVALSSAQLLALNASPVTIVAAPGAGQMLVVLGVAANLAFGTTPYTISSGNVVLFIGTIDEGDIANATAGFFRNLLVNAGNIAGVDGPFAGLTDDPDFLANQPIIIGSTETDPTLGDGTLSLTVLYAVVTL
jgi:hypothetical protein